MSQTIVICRHAAMTSRQRQQRPNPTSLQMEIRSFSLRCSPRNILPVKHAKYINLRLGSAFCLVMVRGRVDARVSRQLASKLLAVASQSLAILPDWVRRSQPTRLSVPTSTYHLVACLVGTGTAVLVDQTTDGSIRFATTPSTCPRRYGDQPFFVAIAQEWRNGPRWLLEHDVDDDDDDDDEGWLVFHVEVIVAEGRHPEGEMTCIRRWRQMDRSLFVDVLSIDFRDLRHCHAMQYAAFPCPSIRAA